MWSRKRTAACLLTNRFGIPVQAREDGSLWSVQGGDGTAFVMETVEDGLQEAVKLAGARKIRWCWLSAVNSMINAKEEVDRETIELPPAQEKLLEAVYAATSGWCWCCSRIIRMPSIWHRRSCRRSSGARPGSGHGSGHGGNAVRTQQSPGRLT